MKVSLRKAHRLVNDLQHNLGIRSTSQVIHHTADDTEVLSTLDAVQTKNKTAVQTALRVSEAISDIRKAVSVLNNTDVDGNSINTLLAEKALIESKMRILAEYAVPSTNTQQKRELDLKRKVKDSQPTSYASAAVANGVSVLSHNEFNVQYVELKKQQEQVTDKLAYINNYLQVEIDDTYNALFTELQVM